MKITLDGNELKKLITEHFNGVKNVIYDEKISIELDVDMSTFSKRKAKETSIKKEVTKPTKTVKPTQPSKPAREPTIEERNVVEAQKGLMASGGGERHLRTF